jgi:hypothetical protein
MDDEIPASLKAKLLRRLLENLRRSLYELQASNGIVRGGPSFSGPQIFPLAKDALYFQSIQRTAKVFDHHPRALSFFKLRDTRPDVVERIASDRSFDLSRLEAFAAKLRRIRNRALAHEDLDDISNDRNVWDEDPITAGEYIECVEFAFAALNAMLNAEFGQQVERLNYTGRDAEELARLAEDLKLPAKWAQQLY